MPSHNPCGTRVFGLDGSRRSFQKFTSGGYGDIAYPYLVHGAKVHGAIRILVVKSRGPRHWATTIGVRLPGGACLNCASGPPSRCELCVSDGVPVLGRRESAHYISRVQVPTVGVISRWMTSKDFVRKSEGNNRRGKDVVRFFQRVAPRRTVEAMLARLQQCEIAGCHPALMVHLFWLVQMVAAAGIGTRRARTPSSTRAWSSYGACACPPSATGCRRATHRCGTPRSSPSTRCGRVISGTRSSGWICSTKASG